MLYLIYFLVINLLAAAVCALDKYSAINGGWRVRENTLFALCLLGGSVGMYLTMRLIRHKTRHKRFMIGIPLIIILQSAVLLVIGYILR